MISFAHYEYEQTKAESRAKKARRNDVAGGWLR